MHAKEKIYFNSPIGIFEAISYEDALISLKIVKDFSTSDIETDLFKRLKTQLNEYFLGKRKTFDIAINPQGTSFQKSVWAELAKIPYGETKNYSEIAIQIKNNNATRAVGNACNKNPIMILIPCHRVISKNGAIGGFAYGNTIKHDLLNLENRIANLSKKKF